MALKLVNKQISTIETSLKQNTRNSMRAQVAGSKGNSWMVSSYRAWQQRTPLGSVPKRNISSLLRLVHRMAPDESHPNNVMAQ